MKIPKILIAILTAIILNACSDSNNDYSLDGTTWISTEEGYKEFSFSRTEFRWIYDYYNEEYVDGGRYIYTPPEITFMFFDPLTGLTEYMYGVITGDELYVGDFTYQKR